MVVDRLKLALIVTVLVLCLGLWYTVSANGELRAERNTAVEALQRVEVQRQRDTQVVAAAQAEKRSQGRKSAQVEQRLSEAAGASEAWAKDNVPEDVRSALSEAVEGLQ